jgi:hypothetical protein
MGKIAYGKSCEERGCLREIPISSPVSSLVSSYIRKSISTEGR